MIVQLFVRFFMCDKEVSELRLYLCLECRSQVLICSMCDRGHIQCRPCGSSRTRRLRTFRNASRRYQSTPIGRLYHRDRQRRHMAKKRAMTQHASQPISENAQLSPSKDEAETVGSGSDDYSGAKPGYYRCHYCRRVISRVLLNESFGRFRRKQKHDRQRDRGTNKTALLC
jgi:DNA-directed RNA polymerase subunit RPC12/RpoP